MNAIENQLEFGSHLYCKLKHLVNSRKRITIKVASQADEKETILRRRSVAPHRCKCFGLHQQFKRHNVLLRGSKLIRKEATRTISDFHQQWLVDVEDML